MRRLRPPAACAAAAGSVAMASAAARETMMTKRNRGADSAMDRMADGRG